MEHCATCQRWARFRAVKHDPDACHWGECDKLDTGREDGGLVDLTYDGSAFCHGVDVVTHETFGCVLHEARGPVDAQP